MKNYINLDGKRIEISDETAKNFREQFKEAEFDLRDGEEYFYPISSNGRVCSGVSSRERDYRPFESKNRKTLERAEAFIKLQNYADKVNGAFEERLHYIYISRGDFLISDSVDDYSEAMVYFSSEELAYQAIKHFGEDFIKLYLGVE